MQRGGGTRRQKQMRKQLRQLAPRIPYADSEPVIDAALAGHLRHLPPSIALWQALSAHVRHAHTDYDALLEEGYDRDAARFFVVDDMNAVLTDWGSAARVTADEDDG